METKLLIESENKNWYLQDTINNQLIFLPGPLKSIFENKGQESSKDGYYFKKYLFLNEKLRSGTKISDIYSSRLSARFVKEQLINTKQITFEVTDNCNLNCSYCAYGELYNDYDERKHKNLKFGYAKRLIDYLADLWNSNEYPSTHKSIAIGFYGGEPLLNMALIKKIISYLEDKIPSNIKLLYAMTTNGVLLDKYTGYLVSKNFNLAISLDGDFTNNDFRIDKSGVNRYSEIYSHVKEIESQYPDFFEANVNFMSVLHTKNSIPDIVSYFKKEFNKIPMISEVNPIGIHPSKVKDFNEIFRNKRENLKNVDNYSALQEDLFIGDPDINSLMYYLHSFTGNVIKDYLGLYTKSERLFKFYFLE